MTLHSSKGLEFPVVCMVGLEQVCSVVALDDPASLEEERRLYYVDHPSQGATVLIPRQ